MTVTIRRIPSTDPRLKRHVRHDDRSWDYRYDTAGLSIVSAKHTRRIPVLDQGQLGSCTGNAGIGCLGTDPYFATVAGAAQATAVGMMLHPREAQPRYSLDEAGAVQLYSDATRADDYPGQYPPDDTGSDGLTIAKVLKAAGEIAGYQHTFTAHDALLALTVTPFITGTNWTQDMFTPDADGRVHPTAAVAGGHEYVADEIDATNEQVWFTNSWGAGWGVVRDGRPGRFYMTFADYSALLAQQGDVTIFTPLTQPAPTPTPADPDAALAAVANGWLRHHHTGIAGNDRMAAATETWLVAKGLYRD